MGARAIIIILTIVSIFSLQVKADGNKRVTGPKAKNTKAWEKNANQPRSAANVKEEAPKGPKAKNMTASDRLANVEKSSSEKTEVLKGPKAKNQKPFRK